MSADAELGNLADYRPYLAAMARIQIAARPWVAPKLDASDLVQQVLLKAHEARADFRGQSSGEVAAWLRQILSRTLANELRKYGQAKRDVGAELSVEAELDASSCRLEAWLAADQTSPSQRVINDERANALANALATLPEDQRDVILLKHCHGISLLDCAKRLNRTVPAVAGLLRRGLQELRQRLDAEKMR